MLNWPWLVLAVFALLWFTYFEYAAFKHPERNNTLSHFVYTIGQAFPLSIFLYGMLVGGLAVHFFWHWCPAINPTGG